MPPNAPAKAVIAAGLWLTASTAAPLHEPEGGPSSFADLAQLTEHRTAEVLAADRAAYDALDVPGMPAGEAFEDPVTGVRTVKVTDTETPAGSENGWVAIYSTLGLQISQPWGPGQDQYTLVFHSPNGDPWLVDYQLGGSTSNYRSAPSGEGRIAFARTPGNERILYVATGAQLRRYDTEQGRFVDDGPFPYDWETIGNSGTWLTLNQDESWASAVLDPVDGVATALNLQNGDVLTRSFSGLDELAMGAGPVSWVIASPQVIWNLDDDSIDRVDLPDAGSPLTHTATLAGFVHYFDVNVGGGQWPAWRISEDNDRSGLPPIEGYWSDSHASGHWWDVPPGLAPQSLHSHSGAPGTFDTVSWEFGLILVDTESSTKRVLGHHYSIKPSGIPGSASDYHDEPHATISNDGKIVLFGSTMNQRERRDVFLMELPRRPAD